jgi:sulfate/thiosulfate-binding protein
MNSPMMWIPVKNVRFHMPHLWLRMIFTSVLCFGVAACRESHTSNGGNSATSSDPANDESAKEMTLLNVSYDPTRELWKEINAAFVPRYLQETGIALTIKQSHGSSGSQARAIIDGLEADVATLSIWSDTNSLHNHGLLKERWEETFPNRSLPYTSTVVFVTRKGNPHGLKDWPDLIQGDVQIITPSPRTSGNGKLSFLAAWGSVIAAGGSEEAARSFVQELYRRVPVLDAGARGATTTFAQKGVGDVHLALENEALLEVRESNGELQIIYPPQSIIHEPHIAMLDKIVDERGTRAVAAAYLNFLYTSEGQEIIAKNFFRPLDPEVLRKYERQFPPIRMFTITDFVANWDEAQAKFFAADGLFDQLYESRSP